MSYRVSGVLVVMVVWLVDRKPFGILHGANLLLYFS